MLLWEVPRSGLVRAGRWAKPSVRLVPSWTRSRPPSCRTASSPSCSLPTPAWRPPGTACPRDTSILLGAQNAHWAPEGGCTGEISMRMAADAGARLIEMGHSERRAMFGETDEIVARKARAAVDHGLIPLICVGEPGYVRAAGQAESYVAAQLSAALSRLSDQEVGRVLVAYEPVWAIGRAGRPATPSEIAPVMSTLAWLLDGLSRGSGCRALLYGGGVHQGNAAELLRAPCTDGLFVGRAAWNVEGFLALLAIGEEHHA